MQSRIKIFTAEYSILPTSLREFACIFVSRIFCTTTMSMHFAISQYLMLNDFIKSAASVYNLHYYLENKGVIDTLFLIKYYYIITLIPPLVLELHLLAWREHYSLNNWPLEWLAPIKSLRLMNAISNY
jgi:hypothetical protein